MLYDLSYIHVFKMYTYILSTLVMGFFKARIKFSYVVKFEITRWK